MIAAQVMPLVKYNPTALLIALPMLLEISLGLATFLPTLVVPRLGWELYEDDDYHHQVQSVYQDEIALSAVPSQYVQKMQLQSQ